MSKKGLIFIVTGPSGVGMKSMTEKVKFMISHYLKRIDLLTLHFTILKSRRRSGLRKTIQLCNSLAHRTTWPKVRI